MLERLKAAMQEMERARIRGSQNALRDLVITTSPAPPENG